MKVSTMASLAFAGISLVLGVAGADKKNADPPHGPKSPAEALKHLKVIQMRTPRPHKRSVTLNDQEVEGIRRIADDVDRIVVAPMRREHLIQGGVCLRRKSSKLPIHR